MSAPVYRSLAEVPAELGATVAAIGNFDGVHAGHREILGAVVRAARERGAKALVVTFTPHPEEVLTPERAPKLITPGEERLELLAETGVDGIVVLRFDAEFAAMSARAFAERVLARGLRICGMHEGSNFRFGCKAEAGVSELAEFGREFGFGVTVHDAVRVHRRVEVSSSAIRRAIRAGRINQARWMLGRAFRIRGQQMRDRGVGAKLVVPTVNLGPPGGIIPALGVYATRVRIAGREFDAVTNVGNRPTFAGAGFAIESHLLNFVEFDAGETPQVDVEFLHRIREERTWPDVEALKAQIGKDVARAVKFFRRAGNRGQESRL